MVSKLSDRSEMLTFTERARRAQILDAAVGLLAEGGFGAASLAAIAARIGVSKGVISYHFAGKDELLEQVVVRVLADAGAYMAPRIEAAGDARAQLRAYVQANIDFLGSHRVEVRAMTAVLTGLPPGSDGAPAYASAGRDAVAALAGLLRGGQAGGPFRDFDAVVVARSLRASIDAITELLRAEPDTDLDSYAAQLIALLEPGLLADGVAT